MLLAWKFREKRFVKVCLNSELIFPLDWICIYKTVVQGEWCINVKFLLEVGQRKKLPVYI